MDYLDIIGRSALAFAFMMVISGILGKPTIAKMTYHDFVATSTLGSITANVAFNIHVGTWKLVTAQLVFAGIAYLLMIVALKNRKLRKWLSGKPTVLIQEGKILENNMRKLKVTLDTLNQELREKNIFNMEEVQYAVLELNGNISVLRKPEYQPVIRKDLNLIPAAQQSFPVELIMDGSVLYDNLRPDGVTKEWLMSELKKRGLSITEISFAAKSSNGKFFCDLYKDRIRHPIDQE